MKNKTFNELSGAIIACAIEVHREMGPGLLESVYQACLIEEFKLQGLPFKEQVRIPIKYKGKTLDKEYYIDFLVDDRIVVELKAIETLLPVHEVQLVTYIKLADKRLGLLINFNVPLLKSGVRRKVNKFDEPEKNVFKRS